MAEYRLLNDGEIIKSGDEFYHCDSGEWVVLESDSSSVGRKYYGDSYQPFRRPKSAASKPKNNDFMRKCDEITEAIRHLHDCKEALSELYKQAGKCPPGVDSQLWARVGGLVGGG